VFSDVDASTYLAEGRNAWHDSALDDASAAFYGPARSLAHARFLERFAAPTGQSRLLDVGCGLGHFVASALASGWDAYGCDPSAPWVERARATVGGDRIALSEPRSDLFGGGFDLVTAWDVLEHVHDPIPFLITVGSLLAPGGRVFIRTPNLTWIYPTYALRRAVLKARVELGPLNHVVYYTARTLAAALRRAGLTPAQWPVLPPPQVGVGNRDPSRAGTRTPATRVKNLHAAAAERIARATRNAVVAGQDLDVIATRGAFPTRPNGYNVRRRRVRSGRPGVEGKGRS
jgi:2-polyprenyl-3-methyl-5-hydroxy-6-metoxy-1,4-benzoquinol methylase